MITSYFLYKSGCLDGLAGSWIARKALGEKLYVVCLRPGREFEIGRIRNKNIYVAGVGLPAEQVEDLIKHKNKIIIMSSNDTYAKQYEKFMDGPPPKSCVMGVWNHFFPKEEPPIQLSFIEDRHCWDNKVPDSADWCTGAHFYGLGKDEFADTMEVDFNQVCDVGHTLNIQKASHVKRLSNNAKMLEVGGYTVPVVNGPNWLASDLGNMLAEGNPFAVVYYDTKTERVFELRSREGGVAVNEVAEKLGGGGQERAAGFSLKNPPVAFDNSWMERNHVG